MSTQTLTPARRATSPSARTSSRAGCRRRRSSRPPARPRPPASPSSPRLLPRAPQAVHEPVHALLLAVPAVAARVHDDQVAPRAPRGGQLVGQGPHREIPQLLVRRGEVDEVLRVRDDRRDTPSSRLPSTNASASRRGTGSAQPCGLETKIWTVSHPSSRAAFRVFASPPEVGRCLPMLFVLPGMAGILPACGGRSL